MRKKIVPCEFEIYPLSFIFFKFIPYLLHLSIIPYIFFSFLSLMIVPYPLFFHHLSLKAAAPSFDQNSPLWHWICPKMVKCWRSYVVLSLTGVCHISSWWSLFCAKFSHALRKLISGIYNKIGLYGIKWSLNNVSLEWNCV